ncbi:uncharacterized protein AMSG_05862 [Thecamonas trahens ATCC 50062]|uniref:Uncharacterized protein n=1 Tax=Thecamonas trahens ATCC 50062 TaxID=461836 RepID=A0A0L0DCP4_THETB|nr:hypothetical protein AMSG_05862 [Thecamonas trahens ATCC 50062]KNC50092.1 hypothetical protein AMSG_05862 [Thecamonas trahens ATCC 50062]|eukprot:XP_013757254.1 hypothetical protein AMSG_05862 [Thecamonas trahens ATCC 50062]
MERTRAAPPPSAAAVLGKGRFFASRRAGGGSGRARASRSGAGGRREKVVFAVAFAPSDGPGGGCGATHAGLPHLVPRILAQVLYLRQQLPSPYQQLVADAAAVASAPAPRGFSAAAPRAAIALATGLSTLFEELTAALAAAPASIRAVDFILGTTVLAPRERLTLVLPRESTPAAWSGPSGRRCGMW